MTTECSEPKLATVAVSDCLRGHRVRWDGDDNGDVWPRRTVERLFDVVGLCPEVGIGLGVPRAPIRLIGDQGRQRAVAVADPRLDYTDRLTGFARTVAPTLRRVSGYVFADRSPSCGLAGVKVFDHGGGFRRVGRGVYAAAVCADHPHLPVADAETLHCPQALVDFAVAVVAYAASGRADVDHDAIRATIRRRCNLVAKGART